MDYEPFSIRQRRLEAQGKPTIYKYDELPERFLVQVMRILQAAIGEERGPKKDKYGRVVEGPNKVWDELGSEVTYELGLATRREGGSSMMLHLLIGNPPSSFEDQIDAIEIAFRHVAWLEDDYAEIHGCEATREQAINELNRMFIRYDLGYQFGDDMIMRIDSQFIHSEVVLPALELLGVHKFQRAEEEFITAHKHYRHGEYKDSIVASLRCLESTMQSICTEKGWPTPDHASAKTLITIVLNNGLLPEYQESHLNSLRSLLEGLSTVRNKSGGHGPKPDERQVPEYLAAYAIHLTAANALLMLRSFDSLSDN